MNASLEPPWQSQKTQQQIQWQHQRQEEEHEDPQQQQIQRQRQRQEEQVLSSVITSNLSEQDPSTTSNCGLLVSLPPPPSPHHHQPAGGRHCGHPTRSTRPTRLPTQHRMSHGIRPGQRQRTCNETCRPVDQCRCVESSACSRSSGSADLQALFDTCAVDGLQLSEIDQKT